MSKSRSDFTWLTRKTLTTHGTVFPKDSILRVDRFLFLEKEAIMNILYFRFANSLIETTQARRVGRDEPTA